MDMKLELVVIPVTDVDRARAFYVDQLGFALDVDHQPNEHFRIVQATPVGSDCSVAFGLGLGEMAPGTMQGLHLVVADIAAAIAEVTGKGVAIDGPFHFTETGRTPGVAPDRADYATFGAFSDPDGNGWVLQEICSRPAGYRLEVVVIGVADVDRAKEFYAERCGFAVHTDFQPSDAFRVVQVDPPGSGCSIVFGTGLPQPAPGAVHGLHLVVTDIVAARDELVDRGAEVGAPFHFSMTGERADGVDPNGADYATFAELRDPDGNTLLLQHVAG